MNKQLINAIDYMLGSISNIVSQLAPSDEDEKHTLKIVLNKIRDARAALGLLD